MFLCNTNTIKYHIIVNPLNNTILIKKSHEWEANKTQIICMRITKVLICATYIIHTIHETDVRFYLYKYYLVLQTNM